MRAVCQVVKCAKLTADGKETASIGRGLLVYIGFCSDDNEQSIQKALKKISSLRVFGDNNGKLNLSLLDISGQMLIVSNFTLYGDVSRGNRPSYINSMGFEAANSLFEYSKAYLKDLGINLCSGVFGADMQIRSVADGPVNIIVDSEDL